MKAKSTFVPCSSWTSYSVWLCYAPISVIQNSNKRSQENGGAFVCVSARVCVWVHVCVGGGGDSWDVKWKMAACAGWILTASLGKYTWVCAVVGQTLKKGVRENQGLESRRTFSHGCTIANTSQRQHFTLGIHVQQFADKSESNRGNVSTYITLLVSRVKIKSNLRHTGDSVRVCGSRFAFWITKSGSLKESDIETTGFFSQ